MLTYLGPLEVDDPELKWTCAEQLKNHIHTKSRTAKTIYIHTVYIYIIYIYCIYIYNIARERVVMGGGVVKVINCVRFFLFADDMTLTGL